MRASPALLLIPAVVFAASPASAARQPWEGRLSLEFVGLPALVATGSGVATLNGSAGGSHLASVRIAGGIAGTSTLPVTDPEVTADGLVALGAGLVLGQGTLGFGATSFGAPRLTRSRLPVGGVARLCLFDPACLPGGALSIPLTTGPGANGVGVGGMLTWGGPALRLSIVASPWTVGTALVTVATGNGSFALPAGGWLHGPLSFTTSTALPGGAFSLVTPVRIESSTGSSLPGFGRLTVRFLPEPGSLVLLASGASGLLLLGRARPAKGRKP